MPDRPPDPPTDRRPDGSRSLAWILAALLAVLSSLLGLAILVVGTVLGHCSAFGGRCPAEPGPLLDNDVFGLAVVGSAMIVVPAVLVWSDSWPTRLRRMAVAVPACVLVGWLAATWAAG